MNAYQFWTLVALGAIGLAYWAVIHFRKAIKTKPPSGQPLPRGDMPRAVGRPWAATGTGQANNNPYSNDE